MDVAVDNGNNLAILMERAKFAVFYCEMMAWRNSGFYDGQYMSKDLYSKFSSSNLTEATDFFCDHGFVVLEKNHDWSVIQQMRLFIQSRLAVLFKKCEEGEISLDLNGWAVSIVKKLEMTEAYAEFINSDKQLQFLKLLLGPDICILGQEALWINHPVDLDPVLNKNIHTDAWSGTSVNTVFSKCFLTDVDEYNGMSVVPGSHLFGFVPVRNRRVDESVNLDEHLRMLNLSHCVAGDTLLWHSLLLHSTTGRSDKNTRLSLTSRYTSTETAFSSQERALGYRPLSVGPMNFILRLIGNDHLAPFRTLGGTVGIDRRLEHLYGRGTYSASDDFEKYIE